MEILENVQSEETESVKEDVFTEEKAQKSSNGLEPPKEADEVEEPQRRAISPIRWDEEETRQERPRTNSVFDNARYFLIKSINFENIEIAIKMNVWSTSVTNEGRFARAFREYDNVLLIFSVCESGAFQGYARMSSLPDRSIHVRWELPSMMRQSNLSYPFKIEWIRRRDLGFAATTDLYNRWNENKPIKIGRDGQEIEPSCGKQLCELFDSDHARDLNVLLHNRRLKVDEIPRRSDRMEERRQDRRPPRQINHESYEAALRFNALQGLNVASTMLLPTQMLANRAPLATPALIANPSLPLMDFNLASRSSAHNHLARSPPRRSPHSRKHRRSRSRSSSLGRIEDMDYEEYLRQAAKGITVFPGSSNTTDVLYDQKVEAFLKGIHRISPTRSRSRSRSRTKRSHSRSYERRRRHHSRSRGRRSRSRDGKSRKSPSRRR